MGQITEKTFIYKGIYRVVDHKGAETIRGVRSAVTACFMQNAVRKAEEEMAKMAYVPYEGTRQQPKLFEVVKISCEAEGYMD
jgi:hypothetical protein